MADWLQSCGIRSVAMESTGVYWIPLFQILETRGFEVFLVNAQHVKNVPGRKSDVSDCQWIQYLHSVGLLKASFRPPDQICVVRSLWRHRESLVQMAAEHTMHMQKACGHVADEFHIGRMEVGMLRAGIFRAGGDGGSQEACDGGLQQENPDDHSGPRYASIARVVTQVEPGQAPVSSTTRKRAFPLIIRS